MIVLITNICIICINVYVLRGKNEFFRKIILLKHALS